MDTEERLMQQNEDILYLLLKFIKMKNISQEISIKLLVLLNNK